MYYRTALVLLQLAKNKKTGVLSYRRWKGRLTNENNLR